MNVRRAAAVFVTLALGFPVAAGPLGDFATKAYEATKRANGGSVSEADIGSALREALAKGASSAVKQLGSADGYWQNPRFKIPLPKSLAKSDALLRSLGAGPRLDELHLSMNRAAESAVPVAAEVFSGAIKQMTLTDVRAILDGAPDAATQYFRTSSSDTLLTRFKPIVAGITAKTGLAQQYKRVLASAGPLAATLGAPDLDTYVAQKALDGLFLRVADEEKAIRENPAARTSALLKKVFAK
ncbi:DUF4197 domain-containing protein [Nevskia sp.]|uniref:DUF4197 domain-containing protein n=1 Tax=Nevskia sp. TaxID=1929292 RepID=UPI0025EEFFD3|nr:DUF4197 domain-containing protein [Nevskia sp.]